MQAVDALKSPDPWLLVRIVVPLVLAFGAAWLLDRLTRKKGLEPPGFRIPWRHAAAFVLLAGFFWLAVFSPLGFVGVALETARTEIRGPELFLLHLIMGGTLVGWFLLGFAGLRRPEPEAMALPAVPADSAEMTDSAETAEAAIAAPPIPQPARPAEPALARRFADQFGLSAPNVPLEIGQGLILGVGVWLLALGVIFAFALALYALGGEKALPKEVPTVIPLIAGLPIWLRLLVSASAGFFEELFFRGFLQPRIGLALSTAFFALAHLSYGQPFMLVGLTFLSVLLGLSVKWRQNIWPAVMAHFVFDAVQLLVIVPIALRYAPQT
jgi:membrane protease YdiL (CAAX protease family)